MGKLAWKIIGTGSAVAASMLATKGATGAWKAITGNDPPTIPEDPETSWAEAIGWALLSGSIVGIARLVATRKAAQYYRKSSGHLPREMVRDV